MIDLNFDEEQGRFRVDLGEMIRFVEKLGINVNTNTKARGHQGFFMKNRIDISALLDTERKKQVLVHEFAHYIHYRLEEDVIRNHGTLEKLFYTQDVKTIEKELFTVTKHIDKNSALTRLNSQKDKVLGEIKLLDGKIKAKYPDFKRSYPFKIFDGPLKKSEAKYLLKYDRVKVKTPFLMRTKEYSVQNFSIDFPQFDETFETYILLKSQQRLLKRVSSRINRLNRYYKRPSELFARFIEGLYADSDFVFEHAPDSCERFFELLENNYYLELKSFIKEFM